MIIPAMKIVFLAPFGIRPKGTLIARMIPLAAALQDSGHTVVIIAPPYTNPEDSGRVEIVQGVMLRNIALAPGNRALSAPLLAWRMFRAALDEKPDLVHLFKPKGYGGLAAMLLLILRRAGLRMPPLFVDTDDWEGRGGMDALHGYSAAEGMLFRFQEGWLLPRADGVTVASRTLESQAWGLGVPQERVQYLPNCVRAFRPGDGAAIRKKLGIPLEAPVVLLYTRFFEFSQEKLHFTFSEIYRQRPDVRFLVVGSGRNGEDLLLHNAAVERGFSSALVTAGWVEPDELPDYLACGDVAIYPFADTLVNRAKCPAKATELLAAGIALVADRVGQLAEYIESGCCGELCAPDNRDEMAAKTVALLENPARRKIMAEQGRVRMQELFNWKDQAGNLDGFYERLSRRLGQVSGVSGT